MNAVETQAAKTFGAIAFAQGVKCAPILDRNLSSLLVSQPAGASIPLFKAWIAGWTEANIAAK